MLNRAAGDRDFTNAAAGAVDQHVRSGRSVARHVALDVAIADVDVAHVATTGDDATAGIVANVRAGDVDLMQINAVHENADAAIMVEVTVADHDVAVALVQADRVSRLA